MATPHRPAPTSLVVSGLPLDIYGLPLHSPTPSSPPRKLAILFLLHGRMQHCRNGPVPDLAHAILSTAQEHRAKGEDGRDVLVVAFDQRNHGHRTVERERNLGWSEGGRANKERRKEKGMREDEVDNVSHAADMCAIQTGTARDVSLLIDFLPPLLFPNDERTVDKWMCAGVSLGGHATWLALAHEPRITLGVPIIGSPSCLSLLTHRASHLSPPIGPLPTSAPFFPASFVALMRSLDPALVDKVEEKMEGKDVLVLSGGEDELVSYEKGGSGEFVQRLRGRRAGVTEAWVQEGVGHACTPEMIACTAAFVWQYGLRLDGASSGSGSGSGARGKM
ncbi:hypothetical protein JCM10207_006788 [Rhodosporidiobolus poonsookiae]